MKLTRRNWVAAAMAMPLGTRAAFDVEGPALARPLAVKSNLLDIVRAGDRLVAAGERGHVLLSDDQGKSWRQAQAVPTRTTLTALHATDAKTIWAAGHGGVILKSVDGGEKWSRASGTTGGGDVLLAIRVEPDGHGLAVGGFGIALATHDGGATWKGASLLEGEAGEKHWNRIVVAAKGTWLIAAEGGTVLRSDDRGARWTAVKTPYAGSLWSGLQLAGGTLVVCGMRGNLVRSTDDGRTWVHQQVAEAGSLTAAATLPDGRCVLVGVDGTLVVGDAAAEKFQFRRLDDRVTLTGVVALAGRTVVVSSAAGPRVIEI